MSGAVQSGSPTLDSDESATALIRKLLTSAPRLEAAVADGRWLVEIARSLGGAQTASAHLVTSQPAGLDLPADWSCTVVEAPPTPEFLLFYMDASRFPDCAVIFAGPAGGEGWATYHRRPLVLYRLRERFNSLLRGSAQPLLAAPAIREELVQPQLFDFTAQGALEPADCVAPDDLYRRVLAAHFEDVPSGGSERRSAAAPTLAAHQERAYERACDILERYGGVIIADAVGLGKTYIGLRLLERALASGGRGLVVVPAALREQWLRELAYLGVAQSSASRSKAGRAEPPRGDNLDLWVREEASERITLVSIESLGRRSFDARELQGADIVLVDEAHNFRNPVTQRYRNLAALVRHAPVVLLTATPINNSVLDLQHLIDLFAAPGAFRHLGIADYRHAFRGGDASQAQLAAIISACVLRRTRRFLRSYYGDIEIHDPSSNRTMVLRFPERLPPVAVEFDLAGTYGDLFGGLEEWLSELEFPTLANSHDSAPERATPAELLKIILLKRLESSVEALRCTVVQQLAWCNTALRALDAGRVLTRPDYRASFQGPDDDPGSQLAFFELMLPSPSFDADRMGEFRRSLERDLQIFTRVHGALVLVGPRGDSKLQELVALIDGPLAGRKILVFTEFLDTARYLNRQFRTRPHVGQIDSRRARLGQERSTRQEVIERFAPHSNGAPEPPERERVDLLITTDVLSEGLNLEDASVVVSYDLPWNPVRLMQRIGRIDRLGAKAERVQLYHFVPADDLEQLLRLMERLQRKVATISTTLGLDQPVLADGDAHSSRDIEQVRMLGQGSEGFNSVEREVEGPLDPEEQAYIDSVEYLTVEQTHISGGQPLVAALIEDSSACIRAVAYWQIRSGKMRRGLWLLYDAANQSVTEDQALALEALRNAREHRGGAPHADMIEAARRAFSRYARGVAARLVAGRLAGDALSPSLPQSRIAARLGRAYQTAGYRLKPEQRATVDRLLDRLAHRFTAEAERSLAELAATLPEDLDERALISLEERLLSLDAVSDEAIALREVATLLLVPEDIAT